jgi:hypothetical protein
MSHASRRLALLGCAAAAALVLAPSAAADPDIDTESAAAVIEELQEQGYTVEINWLTGNDGKPLSSCAVTSIHNPGDPTPDPTTTTTIYVDVTCP